MPRTEISPVANATLARQYLRPSLADPLDPLDPLAEAVGNAVMHEISISYQVGKRPGPTGKKSKTRAGVATPVQLADGLPRELHGNIKKLVAKVLAASLGAQTDQGKMLRMALIGRLASQEMSGKVAASKRPAKVAKPQTIDAAVTTAEAASQLDVSRPYVAMLCDAGKLGEVVRTEGGHRRIRQSSVEAYRTALARSTMNAQSPREAAMQAGLYARSDDEYMNVVRRQSKPAGVAKRSPAARAARSAHK